MKIKRKSSIKFGPNIRRIRELKGLNLVQLAKKTDISQPYLSELERGLVNNPTLDVLQRIADALEVQLQDLLSEPNVLDEQLLSIPLGKGDLARAAPITLGAPKKIKWISLQHPVKTGVHSPPEFSWRLNSRIISSHQRADRGLPIQCQLTVLESATGKEIWQKIIEIPVSPKADPREEARVTRSVAMPQEAFEALPIFTPLTWEVSVKFQTPQEEREEKAQGGFFRVPEDREKRAEVEGLIAAGLAYTRQELLEESIAFFQEALETSCRALIELYQKRGLDKAGAYRNLLEVIRKLSD